MDGESFESAKPGLEVDFKNGLNVLIGENDTGKTTIIDAIKYVLRTQSGEYFTLDEKDFHKLDENTQRATELKIECRFDDLSVADAGAFWNGVTMMRQVINNIWLCVCMQKE